jgi:flagellar hook-associated protein 3 FlgL
VSIARVSDSQTFGLLVERSGQLQVSLRRLQEEVASGRRLFAPDEDPLGAAQLTRVRSAIASLAQVDTSSKFGSEVLGAQDQALGDAQNLMVRAEEIATQQASGLETQQERDAARQEVHGLLEALTAIGNTELAGRRIFAGLALDAPPAFADPNGTGYDPANAYDPRYTQDYYIRTGRDAGERVRLTTRGDQVFEDSLVALSHLEAALAPGGDVRATLAELGTGRGELAAEQASVAARQSELIARSAQVQRLDDQEQKTLSSVLDADLVSVIAQLTQAQTALQATLAAGAQIAQTSLVSLLKL